MAITPGTVATVRDVRIARVWFDLAPELFGDPAADAALPPLTSHAGHADAFEKAGRDEGPLRRPWLASGNTVARSHYWEFYLDADLKAVSAETAHRLLLPLRLAESFHLTTADPDVRGTAETYLYPHGTAAIAQIVIRGTNDLARSVNRWIESVNGVSRVPPTPQDPVSLETAVRDILSGVRIRRLGLSAGASAPLDEPFTVATVVAGDGVDPTAATVAGSLIHQALEGFGTAHPQWALRKPTDLAASTIPAAGSAAAVFYRQRRARTLWFPELFTATAEPIRKLSCYHRNQTFAAMQVEALGALTTWAAERLTIDHTLPPYVDGLSREAANTLARLCAWTRDTYRSRSAKSQIIDNRYVDAINTIRRRVPLPDLVP
jgi:hypothetical protein